MYLSGTRTDQGFSGMNLGSRASLTFVTFVTSTKAIQKDTKFEIGVPDMSQGVFERHEKLRRTKLLTKIPAWYDGTALCCVDSRLALVRIIVLHESNDRARFPPHLATLNLRQAFLLPF